MTLVLSKPEISVLKHVLWDALRFGEPFEGYGLGSDGEDPYRTVERLLAKLEEKTP